MSTTTQATLDVLRRAEELARTHNDGQLADDLYGLGCALGSSGGNHKGDLIVVAWSEDSREWTVSARASDEHDWSSQEGDEGELDDLLSIARDVATGG